MRQIWKIVRLGLHNNEFDAHHCNVVSVEKDLIEFGDPPAFRRGLELGDVFQDHVDEVVEA